MTIEEAYEVAHAIDEKDDAELAGELGDLLLQVVFHANIAEERGAFRLRQVIQRVAEKMVRRHPHVFADDGASTSGEVLRNWEAIKAEERAQKGKLDAEADELREAVREKADARRVAEEVGDLLFVAVNVARLTGVDPESALKAANRKFRRRFQYIEERLRDQGKKPTDSTLEEMDRLWNEAKSRER